MSYNPADLLDQLMGANRNLAPGEQPKKFLHWSDKTVCKYFLCGFCPYELFTNTKADLGNCPNVHHEDLKKNYEDSEEYGKMGYEENFLYFITKILNDCERKITRGRERLRNRKPIFLNPEDGEAYERINNKLIDQTNLVQQLGAKGRVQEANNAMELVEELKSELAILSQRANSCTRYGYDREMEVCTVCGSLTLVNDLPSRFEDHLNGRQHMGFARIRTQESKYWKSKTEDGQESGEIPDKKEDLYKKSRHSNDKDHYTRKHERSRRSNSRSRKHHNRSERRSRSDSDRPRKHRNRSRSPRRRNHNKDSSRHYRDNDKKYR